jgi:hypothetical protein
MFTLPLFPDVAAPVLNTIIPLIPELDAAAVCTTTAPLDPLELPCPLDIVIVPPLPPVEGPAEIDTLPPIPLLPDPTVIDIDPPRPKLATPVPKYNPPLLPLLATPVLIAIAPLTPDGPD